MKPFEVGKTYKNVAGRDVRIVDDKYQGKRLLGIVSSMTSPGNEFTVSYNSNGQADFEHSLIPEKEKVEGWIRVTRKPDGTVYFSSTVGEQQARAPSVVKGYTLLDVIKIEWEG